MLTSELSVAEVAQRFESLGGGSLNENGWAFGCEFGFFQRSAGIEPLGLLRWANINTEDLIRAIECKFEGIGDEANIELTEESDWDWGFVQTVFGIRNNHVGLARAEFTREVARTRISKTLKYLQRSLVEDIQASEKLFTYHTYDHVVDRTLVDRLAKALEPSTLCYVQTPEDEERPFTARRAGPNLVIGYIDTFAPQPGREPILNHAGWEAVCRAMIDVASGRGPDRP